MPKKRPRATKQLDGGSAIPLTEFVASCSSVLIPVTEDVSYFTVEPLGDKDRQRLVFDPVSALPPEVLRLVPNLRLVLVPYLGVGPDPDDGKLTARIHFSNPPEEMRLFSEFLDTETERYIFLAKRSDEYFDAHVLFYQALAEQLIRRGESQVCEPFYSLLHAELKKNVRGEINETAWHIKKELLSLAPDSEEKHSHLVEYRYAAILASLELYLHGLCCDIEVDTGPKRLASRYVRPRLLLLQEILPPPAGVALFPEELEAAK